MLTSHNEYNGFKVGDRVKIVGHHPNSGVTTIIEEILHGDAVGWWATVSKNLKDKLANGPNFYQIEKVEKTMEDLQQGDILVNSSYDYERKVQGILGEIVFTSDTDDESVRMKTIADLKEDGWKIKGTEEEKTELTLEEVAELAGVPVENLRIKD